MTVAMEQFFVTGVWIEVGRRWKTLFGCSTKRLGLFIYLFVCCEDAVMG